MQLLHDSNFQCYFNPLPRKEGDWTTLAVSTGKNDFNPLPRKEGDKKQKPKPVKKPISIHSLVKRETPLHNCNIVNFWHFNPLPRKEGDQKRCYNKRKQNRLKSTPS